MASTQAAPTQDGRLARSARTRRAIVDALRSLHQDGDLRPNAHRVAERAGVSVRTVWQHFEDLESLFVEAGNRDAEIASGYVHDVDRSAPLHARLAAIVDQRARMFEALAPTWRAARLQEPFSPQLQLNRDNLLRLGRVQLEQVFAAELEPMPETRRYAVLNALQVATSWSTWESLRRELGLSVADAHAAVCTLLVNLVPAP
jgi:TetR/AcrR family transcriptional regulator, regulator of autoinduction and epiphytic fitness